MSNDKRGCLSILVEIVEVSDQERIANEQIRRQQSQNTGGKPRKGEKYRR